MKTAALYARVSTQHQVQEATIESQLAKLHEYAQNHDYTVLEEHIYIDQGVSGRSLYRPGLGRLRDATLAGEFHFVLCYSPDRLSRNLGVQQFLIQEWEGLGIGLVFIHRPLQGNSAQEMLLRNIEGSFAEYERAILCDRMQRGRRYRLQQEQSLPWPAPYGYLYQHSRRRQGSGWEVHPAQASLVQEIFLWYTEEPLGMGAIARRLNAQGVASPQGDCWYPATVGRILANPAYKGSAYWGRHRYESSSIGKPRRQGRGRLQCPRAQPRPLEEWIQVPVPAIIDPALWQAAQERRTMNVQCASRNSSHSYLLHGLLVCGICGHTLYGRKRGAYRYYYCPNIKGQKRAPQLPHTCSARADSIEEQLWAALADLLRQPQRIAEAWEAEKAAESQPPAQLQRWQGRCQILKAERKRLLDAYQAGVIALEELSQRSNPLSQELKKLENRLAAYQQHPTTTFSLESFTNQVETALKTTDEKTQQDILRMLIDHVVVNTDELIIHHIIPTTHDVPLYHAFREARGVIFRACALRFTHYAFPRRFSHAR